MRRLATLTIVALAAPAALAAQQPQCVVAPSPDPLPIAMQLVDSMALSTSLPKSTIRPTVFSLWYDAGGQLTHVLALTDTLVVRRFQNPDTQSLARAALGRVIADAAFPQDSGREMSLRLTLARDSGGAMSLAVAKSVNCAPVAEPHSRGPNERRTGTVIERISVGDNGVVTTSGVEDLRRAPALVTFVIDTDGHPVGVLVTRSSGSPLIDSQVVDDIASTRYKPATVDGFPKLIMMSLSVPPTIPALRHDP
jgi:hypothetical protein